LARIPLVFLALGLFAAADGAGAAAPDWTALAALDTVVVETVDEDGAARDTTVWLAVVDGVGYVRTSDTSGWGENAARTRELALEAGGARYPLGIELVEDDAERQRIADAFRAKYGWSDAMVSWMRGSRPKIMRLVPKPQE